MGIYDSGSNISLINSRLLRLKKDSKNNCNNTNLITINGVKKTKGLVTIKIKIFNLEKKIDVYVIDGRNFKYDFLIGLDIIKEFNLIQDENLKITQKTKSLTEEELHMKTNILENLDTKKHLINFNEHVKKKEFIMDLSHLDKKKKLK